MISAKEYFTAAGLNYPHDRIKLVRHSDHMDRSIRRIIEAGDFDSYQAEQHAHIAPFHNCDVILSFIKSDGKLSEFHGAYRVNGHREFRQDDFSGTTAYLLTGQEDGKDRIWYHLEELPEFQPLRGRLIVEWSAPLKWHMTKDQKIHELRPPGRVMFFPGYQNVVLSWKELREILLNAEAHSDWRTALKFTAAIYRITDLRTGMVYIGSAYGREGLWNRWGGYARTGNGGNVKLKPLDHTRFQWSIVRTLSGVMSAAEVIQIEHVEMRKHGSKAVGLNL